MQYNNIRRETGRTAEEWAKELGITRQAVSRRYRLRLEPFEGVRKYTFTWRTQDGRTIEVEV